MGRSKYNGKPPDDDESLLGEIESLRDEDDVDEEFVDADDFADEPDDEPVPEMEIPDEPLPPDVQKVVDALAEAKFTFRQALSALMYLTGTKAKGAWKPALPRKLPKGGMSRPGLVAYVENHPDFLKHNEVRALLNDILVSGNKRVELLKSDLTEDERAAAEKADLEG